MAADQVTSTLSEAERYRVLVEAIADYAIFMLDTEGRVASWNPGARRFKGYETEEILGRYFGYFYSEADRAAGLPERALEVARTEGRFESEGWRLRKDGTRFWGHAIIDAIRSPAGELLGFAKITRDLSEKRAQEEALRRSEEQFRILVQGVTDYALYMLDEAGQVSSWNVGAERIKGYTPDEIIGQHFSAFYTEEDRASGLPQRALETAAREGRYEREGWRLRKDGTRFWAHVVIDAIHNPDGVLIGFAKITRDITEKRDAQISLDQAREQLLQAQKMEAIGQLTGGVAHDFNNLLTAILSSLEMVRKYLPEDRRITRLIDNAEQGAQRGATLTQRLLAYARRQPLDVRPVDVAALVGGLVDLIVPSLGSSTHLETALDAPGLIAVTDPNQLETALLNLCINARDALPDGGQIEISARRTRLESHNSEGLVPGDYICLVVRDEGEGMDSETLSRAAEPFFTTKGVGKGSGLGLPMVHGLAAQSGGRLILKSVRGEGTSAELWLPASDVDATIALEAMEAAGEAGRHLRILAVDDDALVLMNTAMMLEELGHEVQPVSCAREALEVLEAGVDFDLVVTDHAMPAMTGSQLAGIIATRWAELPVLLVTGYAELPQGGLPRLAKPFTQKDLARAVAETAGRTLA
jgi:PAS domain S-box-containing protein